MVRILLLRQENGMKSFEIKLKDYKFAPRKTKKKYNITINYGRK